MPPQPCPLNTAKKPCLHNSKCHPHHRWNGRSQYWQQLRNELFNYRPFSYHVNFHNANKRKYNQLTTGHNWFLSFTTKNYCCSNRNTVCLNGLLFRWSNVHEFFLRTVKTWVYFFWWRRKMMAVRLRYCSLTFRSVLTFITFSLQL